MQLEALRRKRDYYNADIAPGWVRTIWPGVNSFDWFIKHNRAELIARGAILRVGRDYFINGETFPTVARQVLRVPGIENGEGASC